MSPHRFLAPVLAIAACSRPVQTARTTVEEPAAFEEVAAAERLSGRACSPAWSYLFPGLGQLCTGKPTEGGAMVALGVAEIATGIYAATQVEVAAGDSTLSHPAVGLPLVAFQDLYVFSIADGLIARDLAGRRLYAPRDSTADLLAAPFNIEVMGRPKVLLGLLGALAAGIAVSLALESDLDTDNAGGDPNVFGRTFDAPVGYPLGFGIGAGLFTHVAMAEEALFRGYLQSRIARSFGEGDGLFWGSAIFGLAHAPNALAFEGDDRRNYLIFGLPAITALGSYLSWIYKESGYSLAPPTAIHFWYDLLLTSTLFVLSPDDSPISARLRFGF